MLTWAQLLLKILSLLSRLLSFLKIQRAKQEGREEVVSEVNKATEKLKDEFENIDRTDRSFDDAIRRLHDLVQDGNAGTSKTNNRDR